MVDGLVWSAIHCALSMVPPEFMYSVTPVARKLLSCDNKLVSGYRWSLPVSKPASRHSDDPMPLHRSISKNLGAPLPDSFSVGPSYWVYRLLEREFPWPQGSAVSPVRLEGRGFVHGPF